MNVGDLVMVTLREIGEGKDKQKPGLILRFDGWTDGLPQNVLVLTGPNQFWVPARQIRPFPAASMAQTRRAKHALENLVWSAKGENNNDDSE